MKKLLFVLLFLIKALFLQAQSDTSIYWIQDKAPPKNIPKGVKKIIAWYSVYTDAKDTIISKPFEWEFKNQKHIKTTDYTIEKKEDTKTNVSTAFSITEKYDTIYDKKLKPLKYIHSLKEVCKKTQVLHSLHQDTIYLHYEKGKLMREEEIKWVKYLLENGTYKFGKSTYQNIYSYDEKKREMTIESGSDSDRNDGGLQHFLVSESFYYDDKGRLKKYGYYYDFRITSTIFLYLENKITVKETVEDGPHPTVNTIHYEFIYKDGILIRKRKYDTSTNKLSAWIDYQYIY
jgi:hypothetical protein